MAGLSVGGFIAIVLVILAMNVAGVFGYYKFVEKNPDKAPIISVNLDSKQVTMMRWVMIGLINLSLIFSIACTVTCTFINLVQTIPVYGTELVSKSSFGFRGVEVKAEFQGREISGQCERGSLGDDRINTAYFFAVINNLLTVIGLIGTLLVQLNALQVVQLNALNKDPNTANKVWKIMGFLMLASTWCCLFTFYIQQAQACVDILTINASFDISTIDTSCSMGGAGVAQVFNSIFLIGISCMFFIVPSPRALENGESVSDEGKNEEDQEAPEESNKANDKQEVDKEEATSTRHSEVSGEE